MDKDKIVPAGEIFVYQTEDGKTRVECRFEQETVWLSLSTEQPETSFLGEP